MHNLFLGTANLNHNVDLGKSFLLTPANFTVIQKRIQQVNVLVDIDRIIYKVDSGMSGLTANQCL